MWMWREHPPPSGSAYAGPMRRLRAVTGSCGALPRWMVAPRGRRSLAGWTVQASGGSNPRLSPGRLAAPAWQCACPWESASKAAMLLSADSGMLQLGVGTRTQARRTPTLPTGEG